MILHGIDAHQRNQRRGTEINLYSQDTDVMVLAISSVPAMGTVFFLTGTGCRRRCIHLNSIYDAIGPNRVAALPGFHAFTGCETTGKFNGKGKTTCWNVFQEASEESLQSFSMLGDLSQSVDELLPGLETFVCRLYDKRSNVCDIGKLRWELFRKKQEEGQRLPPTRSALYQAALRARYQCAIWINDHVARPILPLPSEHGCETEGDTLMPFPTSQPAAPEIITELVKCRCVKSNVRHAARASKII